MTANELLEILKSEPFAQELSEISDYLCSVTHERPIQYLIAKHLRKSGRVFELEFDKYDLTVDGRHVEIKFNYDLCQKKLRSELLECDDNLEPMFLPQDHGFGVGSKICKDLKDEGTSLLLWVICSRDLSGVPEASGRYINLYRKQRKYAGENRTGGLEAVDEFLVKVQRRFAGFRPFTVHQHTVPATGTFPSLYHFRVCEFTPQSESTGFGITE